MFVQWSPFCTIVFWQGDSPPVRMFQLALWARFLFNRLIHTGRMSNGFYWTDSSTHGPNVNRFLLNRLQYTRAECQPVSMDRLQFTQAECQQVSIEPTPAHMGRMSTGFYWTDSSTHGPKFNRFLLNQLMLSDIRHVCTSFKQAIGDAIFFPATTVLMGESLPLGFCVLPVGGTGSSPYQDNTVIIPSGYSHWQ